MRRGVSVRIVIIGLTLVAKIGPAVWGARPQPLEYAPAPVDNPLKGLVPYQGDVRHFFPHSLEFNYVAYSALVKGYDMFDWQPLERLLDDIASRGHQAVIRIYLEYPDKRGVIPEFLVRDGLKVHRYLNTNTQPLPPAQVETPDYEDPNLRKSLTQFIAAFGAKYDGDPRIGFITAGLLGTWGEWHTYPRSELFASKPVQREVLDAYEAAFRTTPILLRYPAGSTADQHAENASRRFGYHDDSFAWATLDTGRKGDEWFYMTTLQSAGPDAMTKWQRLPIGGEIRPEAWGRVFDSNPGKQEIQDFRACVEATHASWLMDSGMFRKRQSAARIERAEAEVRRMGYEFHAPSVTLEQTQDGRLKVSLDVENRGVAPFYSAWNGEWGLLREGKVIKSFPSSGTLRGLLPGETRTWTDTLDVSSIPGDDWTLAVRIPNPLKGGSGVRFANATQQPARDGWLILGSVPPR